MGLRVPFSPQPPIRQSRIKVSPHASRRAPEFRMRTPKEDGKRSHLEPPPSLSPSRWGPPCPPWERRGGGKFNYGSSRIRFPHGFLRSEELPTAWASQHSGLP